MAKKQHIFKIAGLGLCLIIKNKSFNRRQKHKKGHHTTQWLWIRGTCTFRAICWTSCSIQNKPSKSTDSKISSLLSIDGCVKTMRSWIISALNTLTNFFHNSLAKRTNFCDLASRELNNTQFCTINRMSAANSSARLYFPSSKNSWINLRRMFFRIPQVWTRKVFNLKKLVVFHIPRAIFSNCLESTIIKLLTFQK